MNAGCHGQNCRGAIGSDLEVVWQAAKACSPALKLASTISLFACSAIAANATAKEDAAKKVERDMAKRLAAVAMQRRIGEVFDAIVTGATDHGTFVRALQPRIEGLLIQGDQGLDVGDKLRVKLVRTDVQKGYIDFARA